MAHPKRLIHWVGGKPIQKIITVYITLCKKTPCLEFFWSTFSAVRLNKRFKIKTHSVWMPENTDQKYFEYGHFSHFPNQLPIFVRC